MNNKYIFADSGKHICDGCGSIWNADKLNGIHDLSMRIEAGGVVPSGECPECAALCFPDERMKKVIREDVVRVQD